MKKPGELYAGYVPSLAGIFTLTRRERRAPGIKASRLKPAATRLGRVVEGLLICGLLRAIGLNGNAQSLGANFIVVDAGRPGRVFEGIGAVSAGASSRLLNEYPERQRGEVLDYLFRPNYGAGFQHLKVEIGGEVNSTDGTEPTHMRARGEENYGRGYEWWLMTEAKKRNPGIMLDCLAWGAPGWIGNGHYFSPDMADYVVKFLQGAKRVYGLDIDYTGIWNETAHDAAWIKLLRQSLDKAGLQRVGVVAADDYEEHGWKIAREMAGDPELRAAVARLGVHYPEQHSPATVQTNGTPLWASEDGPWRGDWAGAARLAETFNRNYIVGKFTKTEIWSPVTAYYDTLPLPGSGVLRANEPWSGHYEVQPAVWAVAHTTQFARPGWHYLDSACVRLPGGSCVALQSPDGRDYSLIIETMKATAAEILEVTNLGLPDKTLHVWHTSEARQFERLAEVRPEGGHFSIRLEPQSVYSLTTTTGQHKGTAMPPAAHPLALPYGDDFSAYPIGAVPRYFSDQAGVFEVSRDADGPGMVLRQAVSGEGIQWPNHKDPAPETIMGDPGWQNYVVAADVCIESHGYAVLLGRVSVVPNNEHLPAGYRFKLTATGEWELRVIQTTLGKLPWQFHTAGETGAPLAGGQTRLGPQKWYRMELAMAGDRITVRLDGAELASVREGTHTHGQAGLGCDWQGTEFGRFEVRAVGKR